MDQLRDTQLKSLCKIPKVAEKLRSCFEYYLNGGALPDYFATAKTVFLSKDGTAYPKEGDVRTIAVLPAICKLYETIML